MARVFVGAGANRGGKLATHFEKIQIVMPLIEDGMILEDLEHKMARNKKI